MSRCNAAIGRQNIDGPRPSLRRGRYILQLPQPIGAGILRRQARIRRRRGYRRARPIFTDVLARFDCN